MRRVLRQAALFVAGAAAALAALEFALRLLPVSVGLFPAARPDLWPLYNFWPNAAYTHSTNWDLRYARHGRTNNYGHLAPFDYVPGSRPVIVVGDSYIESQMNDYRDTLQARLAAMPGVEAPVYGMGVSGMSIGDYLALAQLAAAEFMPRAAVFLLVDGDIIESLGDPAGQYHFREAADGLKLTRHPKRVFPLLTRIRRSVGDLYLYRYVTQNLRFTPPQPAQLFREAKARPADAAGAKPAAQFAAIDRFLAELPGRSGIEPRCIAFLLDGERYALYDARLATPPKDPAEARDYFIRSAVALGYRVADLQPMFLEHYRSHHRHFDYYPVDAHWNGLGHQLAAERAYELLFRHSGNGC